MGAPGPPRAVAHPALRPGAPGSPWPPAGLINTILWTNAGAAFPAMNFPVLTSFE